MRKRIILFFLLLLLLLRLMCPVGRSMLQKVLGTGEPFEEAITAVGTAFWNYVN